MQRNSLSLSLCLSSFLFIRVSTASHHRANIMIRGADGPLGRKRNLLDARRTRREIETYSLGSLYYITFYPRIHVSTDDTSPLESVADPHEI